MDQMRANKPNVEQPSRKQVAEEIDSEIERTCFICKKPATEEEIVLLYVGSVARYACATHKGIVQEFIQQWGRPPLGWEHTLIKEGAEDVGKIRDKESKGKISPV